MKKIPFAVLLVAGAVLLSGCVIALGNRGDGGSGIGRKITLGQELSDLKKARDNGAITPAEYETLKGKLVEEKGRK
jgi:hypothetical protein